VPTVKEQHPYTFERCIDLGKAPIVQAAQSREQCKALLDHLSSISRPQDGGPLVLLLFARLATISGAWLDGNVRIDLTADEEGTIFDVMTTLGGGMAERVFPRFRFAVPLSEFEGATTRVPAMIWPLKLEKRAGCITLTATEKVRRSTMPPPTSEIPAAVRFAPTVGATRHDPVTEPHRAKSAIQALDPGEYVDILASIPVGYHLPSFDVMPSPYTPFAGRFAGNRFLRVTRR
jgi:hypothetical protein